MFTLSLIEPTKSSGRNQKSINIFQYLFMGASTLKDLSDKIIRSMIVLLFF